MQKILTTVALAMTTAFVATGAMAHSAQYCENVAQQAVDEATHPVGSAAVGCGAGAIIGSLLTNGNAGGVAGGCALGAGTGLVISDSKRQQVYSEAYNNCMYGSSDGYAPPPPPPAAYQSQWTNQATTMASPYANVRAGEGAGYPVVYQLNYGTNLNIKRCDDSGWCKLEDDNWISQSLLRFY